MFNKITPTVLTITLLGAVACLGQIAGEAFRASGTIEVDGQLNEADWNGGGEKMLIRHDIGMQLTHGEVENYDDCSAEFLLLWNDEGLYCGSWSKDDIHNAPWTSQPGMAYYAWNDDGHEWWVSFDFNDVWEDASPPYYGQFGWQMWKGWTWNNGAPEDKYVAYRNDNEPTNSTTEDLKEQGFSAPFTSADGINFITEAHWKWSSFLMGSMAAPSAGKEIGFNIGLVDNDGRTEGDAWIRWSEGYHGSYQGWGKITLSDENAKIRPIRQTAVGSGLDAVSANVYDVFGRRMARANSMNARGIYLQRNPAGSNGQARRFIVLR